MRILVVDGHEPSRALVEYLLTGAGHSVACAGSVDAAVVALTSGGVDVVIADVFLGVPRGVDMLRRLTETGLLDGVTLVAVTALAMKGDRERILAAGFDAYIAKPIDPVVFISDVERIHDVSRGSLYPFVTPARTPLKTF